MSSQKGETITVIGAGVIGLTSALVLLRAGYRIQVVAVHKPGDLDINYTSPWAGAYYRSVPDVDPVSRLENDLAIIGYSTLKGIASRDESSGVHMIEAFEYLEAPTTDYQYLKGRYSDVDDFRVLEDHELPIGVRFGVSYTTWSINAPVYLAWLERQLQLGGVQFLNHKVQCMAEAIALFGKATAIINCSGWGFGDPLVFPTKGQTVLVANPCSRVMTLQAADGSWTYIIPRPLHGGTIIGGTKQPNDWNPHAETSTREAILQRAALLCPDLINNGLPACAGGFNVLKDIVGRRPTRQGGPRIERETVGNQVVIHAYGVGEIGYKLSWGVAHRVLDLVGFGNARL